jgi:hypothetical protein
MTPTLFLSAGTGGGYQAIGRRRSTRRVGRRPMADPGTQYDTRRSPLPLAVITRSSRHILVCGGILRIPDHDAVIRIGSEAPKQR